MGIEKIIKENNTIIGVWKIEESLEELLKLAKGLSVPNAKNKKRKKELLATRLLLHNICPGIGISYTESGAPEINTSQGISISHSKELAVILLGDKKVGVDIEKITTKILKLTSKFIANTKDQNLSKEKATLIWCAKEAIYKWHQIGNINFINDINIHKFKIKEKGEFLATFRERNLLLQYQKIHNHYLVYLCK